MGKLLTLARTFSNEAGLTSEKQIKNTSYRNQREQEKNKTKTLKYKMKLHQKYRICKIISVPFPDSALHCGTGMKVETERYLIGSRVQTEEAFSFITRISSG